MHLSTVYTLVVAAASLVLAPAAVSASTALSPAEEALSAAAQAQTFVKFILDVATAVRAARKASMTRSKKQTVNDLLIAELAKAKAVGAALTNPILTAGLAVIRASPPAPIAKPTTIDVLKNVVASVSAHLNGLPELKGGSQPVELLLSVHDDTANKWTAVPDNGDNAVVQRASTFLVRVSPPQVSASRFRAAPSPLPYVEIRFLNAQHVEADEKGARAQALAD